MPERTTKTLVDTLADCRERMAAAGGDETRRAAALAAAVARLFPPAADPTVAKRAAVEAALATADNAAAMRVLGVRAPQALTAIAPRLPETLIGAAGKGGTIVAPGTVAMLTGEGGIAKSALALSVACGMAGRAQGIAGEPPLFDGVAGAPVLMATFEDDPAVTAWRATALANSDAAGFEREALARVHVLNLSGQPLYGPTEGSGESYGARPGPLAGWSDLWAAADATRARLIVIDPALAAYVGEANAAAPVREFLGAVADEAGNRNAGVLIVAHSTKAARSGGKDRANADSYDPGQVSGSGAWTDGARATLTMTWQGDDSARFRCLAVAKANYGPARIWCRADPIHAGSASGSPGAIVGFARALGTEWQAGEPKAKPNCGATDESELD